MTEQAKVPAIRFAGFTDPWEQRKLGELFFESNERSSSMEILSVSVAKGIYPASESDRDTNPGASLVNYKVVHKGDVVYNSMRMWQGAVGSSDYDGIVSPAYVVARPTIELDSTCFGYLLKRPEMLYKYLCDSQGNSKDTQTLKYDRFADIEATMPANLEEQRAISACLGSVDHLITLHQRKYDKLVVFKKSMLEKMFPKDGESVPEIRFAGFTDPWEQRKLGDVASSFDYGLNAAATEYDGQNKYLRITDIDDETHEFSKSDLTTPLADLAMSADYLLKEGDLLFARTGASVGKTYLYRQFDGMVYFAGFLIRARIGEGADPEFAYQATLTDAYKKYVAITSQRSGQPGVNAQEYADYQLMLPSKTEQQQIGMTLRSLDDLITLHQRKLELLQNIKKSLLDKMFA